jgi:signal transduction histidine kinase
VRVGLSIEDSHLAFSVVDNGKGFDPATAPKSSGLQNMRDRMDALGGSLEVRSAPGTGTTVSGRLPVS